MKTIVIKSYDAYKYADVLVVVEYKGRYVYKTKHIGYADRKDVESNWLCSIIPDVVLSSISIDLTRYKIVEIDILTKEEIEEIVKKTKIIHSGE